MENVIVSIILSATLIWIVWYSFKWLDQYFYHKEKVEDRRREEDMKWRGYRLGEVLANKKFSDTVKVEAFRKFTKNLDEFALAYISNLNSKAVSPKELLSLLDTLIETEFNNHIIIPRTGNGKVPPVDDVKEETKEIADAIMTGLTPEFFAIFKAAGLSEDYVMRYVTREIFAKIIIFTRNLRSRKKDNGE